MDCCRNAHYMIIVGFIVHFPNPLPLLETTLIHISLLDPVLWFDILKGALPVWAAYRLDIPPNYLGLVAIAATLGHMYPIFFKFEGGKAVATAFGTLFPIGWGVALLLIVTWVFVAKKTKYSSLAAIITVLLAPLYTWLLEPIYTYPVIMISVLIIIRHRSNIMRLIKGQESKINNTVK